MSSLHGRARKSYLFVDEATQMKIVKHSKYSLICILSAAWIAAGCSAFRWDTEAEKRTERECQENLLIFLKHFFSLLILLHKRESEYFIPIKFPVATNDTFNSQNAKERAAGRGMKANSVIVLFWNVILMWQLARAKHIPANKDYNYRSSKMRNCFGSIMGKMKIIRQQIRGDNEEKRRYFQLHKSYYVCFYVTKITYEQAGKGSGHSEQTTKVITNWTGRRQVTWSMTS